MCTYIRVSAKKKTLVKCRHWDECNSMRSTRRCRLAINIYQRQLALEGRPESKHWQKGNNCRERLTLSLNPMDDAKSSPKCERREVQLVPREEGPAREEASWRGEAHQVVPVESLKIVVVDSDRVVQLQVDDHVM